MDLTPVLAYLETLHPAVQYGLVAVGTLYVLAKIYVALTPSEKDDEAVSKVEKIPVVGAFLKASKRYSAIKSSKDQ